MVENLSSALDNGLLNATEISAESTPASIAEMLCSSKMFKGAPDASNSHFLTLVSHLAYATKQQVAFNSRPIDALGDDLREMFFMVSYMSFLLILLS